MNNSASGRNVNKASPQATASSRQ